MDRFLAKVQPHGECLLWTGGLDKDGYARFAVWVDGRWVDVLAHVWIWEQHHGPVPAGHSLDHRCHSFDDSCPPGPCPHRACVRTEHLEPVTPAEQSRRARERTELVLDDLGDQSGWCLYADDIDDEELAGWT